MPVLTWFTAKVKEGFEARAAVLVLLLIGLLGPLSAAGSLLIPILAERLS